jgi:hypothetical protein
MKQAILERSTNNYFYLRRLAPRFHASQLVEHFVFSTSQTFLPPPFSAARSPGRLVTPAEELKSFFCFATK